ncbi:carbohydrate sulfotransferase 15-like [Diadema setosum]|uniref:carbohydrate sulfotransferase 15-like n=1 Tax=Diadema setosum TaxID=31175 RepID=UPI003B3ABC5D
MDVRKVKVGFAVFVLATAFILLTSRLTITINSPAPLEPGLFVGRRAYTRTLRLISGQAPSLDTSDLDSVVSSDIGIGSYRSDKETYNFPSGNDVAASRRGGEIRRFEQLARQDLTTWRHPGYPALTDNSAPEDLFSSYPSSRDEFQVSEWMDATSVERWIQTGDDSEYSDQTISESSSVLFPSSFWENVMNIGAISDESGVKVSRNDDNDPDTPTHINDTNSNQTKRVYRTELNPKMMGSETKRRPQPFSTQPQMLKNPAIAGDAGSNLTPHIVMDSATKFVNVTYVSRREFEKLKRSGILKRNISRKLFNVAPEVFLSTPLEFSKHTKSPCWFVNVTTGAAPELRCLPYFYLMGMPKCGTTDLFSKITRHPSVVRTLKEPHWWTRMRVGRFPRGGDASASTMWYQLNLFNISSENQFPALPEVFREINPGVKLIAMLREPAERVYSGYMYFRKGPVSPTRFHQLAVESILRFQTCAREMSARMCVQPFHVRVTLGLYSVLLSDWLEVFPRDQILVLRLRDWNANCIGLLPTIFQFLEIEELPKESIVRLCTRVTRNVNKRRKAPMLQKTAQILRDFFRPYNEELATLLQDKRFLWLD